MAAGPARREVLAVSAVSLVVVIGGVVAAAVLAGAAPAPSYATDAPVAEALLPQASDLPGWHAAGHGLYRQSDVVAHSDLSASPAQLRDDRGCASIVGPTAPRQVTALADNQYDEGAFAGAQLYTQSVVYDSPAPVAADAAAARTGFVDCMRRLLQGAIAARSETSQLQLHPVDVGGGLGDVSVAAAEGSWSATFAEPGGPQVFNVSIEVVRISGSRAECVFLVEAADTPIPQATVDRLARRSAQELQARLG